MRLRTLPGIKAVHVTEDVAFVGGGSLPDQSMKTCVVEITATELSDATLAYRLRIGTPAVMGRLRGEAAESWTCGLCSRRWRMN